MMSPAPDDARTARPRPSAPGARPDPRRASRRQFLRLAGAGAASLPLLAAPGVMAGPFSPQDVPDHLVPADKKLSPEWLRSLSARGRPAWCGGSDLKTIGMPVGGVCAGQLYLTGDGRLAHWDIFNQPIFTGYGRDNYRLDRRPETPLQQGFVVRAVPGRDGPELARTLDARGFPGVRFRGEYPIGRVVYRDDQFPVRVELEAFSPFIPLNAADSALPATVLAFALTNETGDAVDVELAGWLENGVCRHSGEQLWGARINRAVRGGGATSLICSARSAPQPAEPRRPITLADFEGGDYGDWTAEGEAFGTRPARGALPGQQPVSGFQGRGLANTFLDGDRPQGKLTSPPFTIERPYINFLIGGGRHAGRTCMNLLVDGQAVRTAAGANRERLAWRHWNVRELMGRRARIEIVDAHSGGWGHINVDQIEMADRPRAGLTGPLEQQADFGTMALAALDPQGRGWVIPSLDPGDPAAGALDRGAADEHAERPFGERLVGGVGQRLRLAPHETGRLVFLVAWCFPNRPEHGNYYATRFGSAGDVVRYVAGRYERLAGETRRWRDTWYDSTLPYWLLDRLFSTVSTLATSTCQWWANGRFWAWEGVGCCRGTCAHVWNYEHALARLFPELERSVREMQDFNPEAGFVQQTGMIRFRGENWSRWAGDGQAGTVLKAYREHLISADDGFLRRNWPRIRKAMEFLIGQDGDDNGLLEGPQHNTYDIDFYGPNTMVGSLYLAALRAAERMARRMGDQTFADRCRKLADGGAERTVQRLFNGEYFLQEVDLTKHPEHQYGGGCLSDQLFGQGWAHQVGLGYLYPADHVRSALKAVWKYNWAPDVGPYNQAHVPERWFVSPGEAGLFTCTWPLGGYLNKGVRYKNEVWTGIEYQVAGHMAWEGMLTEALAICRGVHDRYHPSKHNPYNEVECGDHYARALASYGVFLGLCGFEYDGPERRIGFAPRLTPERFRAAFTAAEGWGTFEQLREASLQRERLTLAWGRLALRTLSFTLPEGAALQDVRVLAAGRPADARAEQSGPRVQVVLEEEAVIEQGQTLEVRLAYPNGGSPPGGTVERH